MARIRRDKNGRYARAWPSLREWFKKFLKHGGAEVQPRRAENPPRPPAAWRHMSGASCPECRRMTKRELIRADVEGNSPRKGTPPNYAIFQDTCRRPDCRDKRGYTPASVIRLEPTNTKLAGDLKRAIDAGFLQYCTPRRHYVLSDEHGDEPCSCHTSEGIHQPVAEVPRQQNEAES